MNVPENSSFNGTGTPEYSGTFKETGHSSSVGEDMMAPVVFESFVNDMTVKLKNCVRSELNVLLKQQQTTAGKNDQTGEKNGRAEPDESSDTQSSWTTKVPTEDPDHTRDDKIETSEVGNFENLGFDSFTDEITSKLEQIVLSELVEITKQKRRSETMTQTEEDTIYPRQKNGKHRENREIPTSRKSSKLQGRASTEYKEMIKPDNSNPSGEGEEGTSGIQSFGNDMVSRIEAIVRQELSSLSGQIQELRHQQQKLQQPRSEPTSITFVTINGKPDYGRRGNRKNASGNSSGREYFRGGGGDMDFKVDFVNKLVKRIERSVKCELIVMSTQKDVIPNITRRLDIIGKEIDGVRNDVMTLHGYASCVDDVADFQLPDTSIQDGMIEVRMELLKLSEAMDVVVRAVTKLTGGKEKGR